MSARPDNHAEIEALARSVVAFVRHRPGRLAVVTVRLPTEIPTRTFTSAMEVRLDELGLAQVTVHSSRGGDRPVVVSVEFDR